MKNRFRTTQTGTFDQVFCSENKCVLTRMLDLKKVTLNFSSTRKRENIVKCSHDVPQIRVTFSRSDVTEAQIKAFIEVYSEIIWGHLPLCTFCSNLIHRREYTR